MILLQSHQQYMTAKSTCMLFQTQIHNLQLIQFPSYCGKQKDLRFDFNSERRVNCLSDDVKAEEHPNILLHLAPFDHDENYNPLQSFATYALSPNVFAVQCCRKKT